MLSDPKSRFKPTSTAVADKSNILSALKQPYSNAARIAGTMRNAYLTNGSVSKVIDYYQSHPTYNYNIYPVLGNKQYELNDNVRNSYIDIAYYLRDLNIKFFAPIFFKETLIDGVTFWYKYQDKDGVGYMKLPMEWCLIRGTENGVYRYMFDITKLSDETVESMPEEFQNAYQQSKSNNTSDTNTWYNNKYYYVQENGMAFTFDYNSLVNGGLAISPFASALTDIISLAKAKDNVNIKDNLDATRILQQKLPMDPKDGEMLISAKEAMIYDQTIRGRLPEGVILATTPTELENIPLTNSGTANAFDTVNKGLEQVFFSMGGSSPLFGGSTTSSNIVKEGIKKDANWIYTNFFPMLENYYNSEIATVKTKDKLLWNIKFIRQSNFTLHDDIMNLKDQLTLGGSRTDYLAANGFIPAEIISKLTFEQQALDIDSLMVVKPTSNTLSAKDAEVQKRGRPKTDNPSDDTDRLDDEQG